MEKDNVKLSEFISELKKYYEEYGNIDVRNILSHSSVESVDSIRVAFKQKTLKEIEEEQRRMAEEKKTKEESEPVFREPEPTSKMVVYIY